MKPADNLNRLIKKSDVAISCKADKRIIGDALEHLERVRQTAPAETPLDTWRIVMKSRMARYAAGAVIAVIVLGGVTFWPGGGAQNDKWWLGPSAAWGQEIMASLEKVQAIVYRQRAFRVSQYGPDTMSPMWERRWAAKDGYRGEVYDDANNVVSTRWIVPQGEGFVQYDVWPEHKCYTQEPEKCPPFYDNVMGWLRRWVSFLDRAERILGTQTFDGRKCVGFEVAHGMYEGFLVQEPVHIWFDVQTKMPVRVERRGVGMDRFWPRMKHILIYDQFEYYREVPYDIFAAVIPEGFVNAHPDEIVARERQMVFADVPPQLKDEVIGALNQVQTAVFWKHSEITIDGDLTVYPGSKIYLSPQSWRQDSYGWKGLEITQWFALEKEQWGQTNGDIRPGNFRLVHTTVNFHNGTYSIATLADETRSPGHPMEYILSKATFIDRADRMLEQDTLDGVECFGVEISASKWGEKSAMDKVRIWIAEKTKLPLRIEFEDWQDNGAKLSLRVWDRFEWNPKLPPDTFTPKIPEGFELVGADGG